MSPSRIIGIGKAIKEGQDAQKEIAITSRKVLTDVLVNDMLRTAKINAKGRILGRGGTGRLAREIFHKVFERGTSLFGSLNVDLSKVPYGRIHEKGGVIRARKARFLTIPFEGVKGFARDFENTFIHKGVIFQEKGVSSTGQLKLRPLFTLKAQVVIPKRPYLEPAIKKHSRKLALELKKKLNKE